MEPEKEKASVVQNIDGEHHKVVGGNIIYGDAHIHIHSETSSKIEAEKINPEPDEAGPILVPDFSDFPSALDPEVEVMLTKLNLMSLKSIFVDEDLTMSDLAKLSKDDLKDIGVLKMKHRLAIIDEVTRMLDATSKCTGTITLSATGAAAKKWSGYHGSYEATGEENDGAAVYRKSEGRYLYRWSDGTWRAGVGIGWSGYIKSVGTAPCPASIRQWEYHDGEYWQSGDITAQCSVHTQ